jgi:sugar lactone lactonase YvrE
MYTRAARDSGSAVATGALHDATLGGSAENMAFDRQGNLWVADANGYILKYTAAQLVAGGEQTADVQISSSLSEPWAIAFDDSGNAWVADAANNNLVEFAAGSLSDTGSTCTPAPAQCTPTPVDTVGSNGNSINSPSGLAFDAQGNLWVANGSGSTVVMFTRAQLLSNGAPAPQVTITTPSGSIPNGIAFDNRGSLWVSDALVLLTGSGSVFGFTASQIGATGAPTPAVTLTSALTNFNPQQMAFDPGASAVAPSSSRVHRTATHARSQSRTGVNPNVWRLLHHGNKM